jgi:hypothetical protein
MRDFFSSFPGREAQTPFPEVANTASCTNPPWLSGKVVTRVFPESGSAAADASAKNLGWLSCPNLALPLLGREQIKNLG